ncbi:MAG TPA: hypothetical protein VE078_01345, partial [Thermoanaerobaculia bacterium]|nr:hypothetical protein [Thermoanaerobaculia bacterium]
LYRTNDYGATWTRIDKGIDPLHFTRVVRANPTRRGLLYAGTERGVYVSFDDGGRWEPLQLNLPIVPITDLAVKGDELIAATQGRGFWILGGLSVLRQLPSENTSQVPTLFEPAPAVRVAGDFFIPANPANRNMGTNPPAGSIIYYFLEKVPSPEAAKEAKLEILDREGKVIRSFSGEPAKKMEEKKPERMADAATSEEAEPEAPPAEPGEQKAPKRKKDEEELKAPMEAGLNRFVWDLLYPAGKVFPGMVLWSGEPFAPMALPGDYQVRLTVGEVIQTKPLKIVVNPRTSYSPADLEAQHQFLQEIRAKLDETHDAIRRIRDVRGQLDGLRERLEDLEAADPHKEVLDAAKALDEKMTKVEEALYQTKNRSAQDPLNFPIRLNDKLNAVAISTGGFGDTRPTDQAVQVKEELTRAIDAELAKLAEVFTKDLPAFNELAAKGGVATVILSPSRLK